MNHQEQQKQQENATPRKPETAAAPARGETRARKNRKKKARNKAYGLILAAVLLMLCGVGILSAEEGTATVGLYGSSVILPAWGGWVASVVAFLCLWSGVALLWKVPPLEPPVRAASDEEYDQFRRDARLAASEGVFAASLGDAPGEKAQPMTHKQEVAYLIRGGLYRIFLGSLLFLLDVLPGTGISGWVYMAFKFAGAGIIGAGVLNFYLAWHMARDKEDT